MDVLFLLILTILLIFWIILLILSPYLFFIPLIAIYFLMLFDLNVLVYRVDLFIIINIQF